VQILIALSTNKCYLTALEITQTITSVITIRHDIYIMLHGFYAVIDDFIRRAVVNSGDEE